MNIEKMAEFLKSLREDKDLTQDQLGDMLNVSRSLVSKWEHGTKIPAVDCLMALSKIYDITIDEIIYGERKNNKNAKDIENLSATIMNEIKLRIYIANKIFFTIIGFLLFLLCGSYFIFNYNSIKVYNVSGENETYDVKNTLMIISKNKSYIKFGDITSMNNHGDKDYDGYEFYAKDGDKKIILSNREDGAVLRNFDDSDNYLNFANLGKFINDLYVDIYYNDEVETIKLDATLEMANNKIFNINNNDGSSIKKTNDMQSNSNLPKFVQKNFTFDETNNLYKYEESIDNEAVKFEYHDDTETMYINNGNIQYLYEYKSDYLQIISFNDRSYKKLAIYDLKSQSCEMFDCDNNTDLIKKFQKNYYELIKK